MGSIVNYEKGVRDLLALGIKKFKKYLSSSLYPCLIIPEIIVSTMNKTWLNSDALMYLRSLDTTLTTNYLENELIEGGWAGDAPSKRDPRNLLTFEPAVGGQAHIVLWGTYGRGWGSYDKEGFLENFTKKLMIATRHFSLKKVWIDLRNEEGRVDRPFPVAHINVSFPEVIGTNSLVVSMAVPRCDGMKTKPSVYDRIKITEEWERQKLVLDGLK
jgi:hypothetical protein